MLGVIYLPPTNYNSLKINWDFFLVVVLNLNLVFCWYLLLTSTEDATASEEEPDV